MTLPSGEQWTIRHSDHEVVVVQVGGGIRSYTSGGRPVLHGYAEDAKADAGRGQLLMPWPNRVRDGTFTFEGRQEQLALSEPARSNASHGLVRWALWELVDRSADELTVACRLLPQQGWDWPLDLRVTYALEDDGLTVTPSATNIGTSVAPFGFGAHPYLTAGEQQVDELTLQVPAGTVLDVDDRLIPTGTSPVSGVVDFREPRPIEATTLDHAYTDLRVDEDGRWRVTISRGDTGTTLWADASAYPYAQVFTGDSLPPAKARRTGVAVEPMSCPANALATGEGLLRLDPGETWSASWGVLPKG
ncbi:aldose 1-epimerase family protein [Luteipulveratus flavus]|uniref:Aldose 1-epimerase family protein n=1 Tax=Luteipulveratus flavus TaxID=3031728 RepID=A0ABT6C7A6_9MICO|nr:aldose 1-epimerase family protein [Luteipulveratus sp. YIM 133296]MDF8264591.1 aldose 1-epimerase family protein [Luteipulveratus sp. YIM 133296]